VTDPARAADEAISWWDREKFKIGFVLGFLTACWMVWVA